MAKTKIPAEIKQQADAIVVRFNTDVLHNDPEARYVTRYRDGYLYLGHEFQGRFGPICRLTYTGDIDDWRVRPLGGYLSAEFRHQTETDGVKRRQKWFESEQESDGTLRVAGIITALLQSPPLTLIGIEEPELTVHVDAIPLLCDYLKQAAERGQVLVTTHSVELLEQLDVEDIRVVERRDGVSTVGPVDGKQREAVKKRLLAVGDIVTMEGLKQQELPLSQRSTNSP